MSKSSYLLIAAASAVAAVVTVAVWLCVGGQRGFGDGDAAVSSRPAAPVTRESLRQQRLIYSSVINEKRRYGFIDGTGEVRIDARYETVGIFSEGLAPAQVEGKGWQHIDKDGRAVYDAFFQWAGEFHEGIALVSQGWPRRYAFINRQGARITGYDFAEADYFSGGLAAVVRLLGDPATGKPLQKSECGYISRDGRLAIPLKFRGAAPFSEGRAAVAVAGGQRIINDAGEFVSDALFSPIGQHTNGLAPARRAGESQWGYVDREGEFVIAPHFDGARSFAEGLAAVKIDDKWGYIDIKGDVVIAPAFDEALPFSQGRAAAMVDDKWGYIDKRGVLVISPRYYAAGSFDGGVAYVLVKQDDIPLMCYVDMQGNVIWQEE
ncbi:MAG: WG repeat-containing protein [Planctomycetota bacterium]|jgi:hypothetical protein